MTMTVHISPWAWLDRVLPYIQYLHCMGKMTFKPEAHRQSRWHKHAHDIHVSKEESRLFHRSHPVFEEFDSITESRSLHGYFQISCSVCM
jgi:hypothetical protein